MPQSLLGQLKEKRTYRVWCLYSSFFHALKGLSHEMDFNNVDENWQMLAFYVPQLVFEFFGGPSDFYLK